MKKKHCRPIEVATTEQDCEIQKYKPQNATLPPVKAEMTHTEFKKFKVDWQVFKRRNRLPIEQVAVDLYSACNNAVKDAIDNACDDFFSLDKESIISLVDQIVTK